MFCNLFKNEIVYKYDFIVVNVSLDDNECRINCIVVMEDVIYLSKLYNLLLMVNFLWLDLCVFLDIDVF